MAIIRFRTLANNQSISFNPATDILQFDLFWILKSSDEIKD